MCVCLYIIKRVYFWVWMCTNLCCCLCTLCRWSCSPIIVIFTSYEAVVANTKEAIYRYSHLFCELWLSTLSNTTFLNLWFLPLPFAVQETGTIPPGNAPGEKKWQSRTGKRAQRVFLCSVRHLMCDELGLLMMPSSVKIVASNECNSAYVCIVVHVASFFLCWVKCIRFSTSSCHEVFLCVCAEIGGPLTGFLISYCYSVHPLSFISASHGPCLALAHFSATSMPAKYASLALLTLCAPLRQKDTYCSLGKRTFCFSQAKGRCVSLGQKDAVCHSSKWLPH